MADPLETRLSATGVTVLNLITPGQTTRA